MGLKPLSLLLRVFGGFVLLFVGWCGLVDSLLLVLALFLAFWMGPTGCDPAFCVVWFRFRLLRRYLALWPAEVGRVYRLLEMVGDGLSWAWVLFIFFLLALPKLAFSGILMPWRGLGLVCLLLSNLAGPVQHFKAALLDAWRNKVAADLCGRKGFRGGPLLDIHGSLSVLWGHLLLRFLKILSFMIS